MERQNGINQFVLRLFGIAAMCFCSLGVVLENAGWSVFGWMAFPVFAFLLTEGFHHTVDRKKYLLRLVVFAALSEPFFDLLMLGKIFDMSLQNPMFTLLLGYLAIWLLDIIRERFDNYFLTLVALTVLIYLGRLTCHIFCMQFADFGVAVALMFYIADKVTYPRLLELACMAYIGLHLSSNVFTVIRIFGIQYELTVELFSLIGLVFIWLYNGERGRNSVRTKILFYFAYPLHLLLVYLIAMLF